jgi:hypothetical protein
MVEAMGIKTGIDLPQAVAAGVYLRQIAARELPGRYHTYHLGHTRRAEEKAARARAAEVQS